MNCIVKELIELANAVAGAASDLEPTERAQALKRAAEVLRTLASVPDPRPGDIESHDDMHRTLGVVMQAYGWTLDKDGYVCGLVAGDMGYESTNIKIPRDHITATAEVMFEYDGSPLPAELQDRTVLVKAKVLYPGSRVTDVQIDGATVAVPNTLISRSPG